MAWVLQRCRTRAAPTPRSGQTAPKIAFGKIASNGHTPLHCQPGCMKNLIRAQYSSIVLIMHQFPITCPKLVRLFAPGGPNDTMLFATLQGRYPGRALVDNATSPSQAVVRTHYGTTFFGGRVTDGFLADAVAALCTTGAVRLVVPEEDFGTRSLPSGRSRIINRLEFTARDLNRECTDKFMQSLPATCRIVPIDRNLLMSCLWHDEILAACGNVDSFFAHGRGVCLIHYDEVLSEAYAVFTGAGRVELGVVTKEGYRGRNYAAITCAPLIRSYDTQGIPTYWSCHQTNTASIRVARKLGYTDERSYRWIRYEARVEVP